jgi:hypothetical protein
MLLKMLGRKPNFSKLGAMLKWISYKSVRDLKREAKKNSLLQKLRFSLKYFYYSPLLVSRRGTG